MPSRDTSLFSVTGTAKREATSLQKSHPKNNQRNDGSPLGNFTSPGDIPLILKSWEDINDLHKIDSAFLGYLQDRSHSQNPSSLYHRLLSARASATADSGASHGPSPSLSKQEESSLLMELAPLLEEFITLHLRGEGGNGEGSIPQKETPPHQIPSSSLAPRDPLTDLGQRRHYVKQQFVQKRVSQSPPVDTLPSTSWPALFPDEVTYINHVTTWLSDPSLYTAQLLQATAFTRWALQSTEGRFLTAQWLVFRLPEKENHDLRRKTYAALQDAHTPPYAPVTKGTPVKTRGFDLTDEGPSADYALDQAHYCLYCHKRDKDTCSTGKKTIPKNLVYPSPHQPDYRGCPLDQKISEMTELTAQGWFLGALAIAMVDNPLLPITGHRICHDCSLGCLFDTQSPVDVPSIETHLWQRLLDLPWGFEIYHLLTRWNPLNLRRPLPKCPTGKNILVVGMGPAGIGLSYQLLMEGHTVVGIDGSKIEPLFPPAGSPPPRYFHHLPDYFSSMGQRLPTGFGGVMEYGITSRWNKNYLLPLRLVLHRWHQRFTLQSGLRYGSTLTHQEALDQGFHHVALCTGASEPIPPSLPDALAPGAKMAADFLMTLQSTGAQRMDALIPLTLDLPCYVVGGGLTAVDAATEALAYYPHQVRKIKTCFEQLERNMGRKGLQKWVTSTFSNLQQRQLQRWLDHATILGEAYRANKPILPILQEWGGVTILYRRDILSSPANQQNAPELKKALEEGVTFLENARVTAVHTEHPSPHHSDNPVPAPPITSITVRLGNKTDVSLPAGSLLWALGTASDDAKTLENNPPSLNPTLSRYGDADPAFRGSVVKALASAKYGVDGITKAVAPMPSKSLSWPWLSSEEDTGNPSPSTFPHSIFPDTTHAPPGWGHVVSNTPLSPWLSELVIHAPLQARTFQPGMLYRLQPSSYHGIPITDPTPSPGASSTPFLWLGEGVAMSGVKTDATGQALHFLVWTVGLSTTYLRHLTPGTPLSILGPTGCASYAESGETVLLIGGQVGVTLGAKLRQQDCKVLYVSTLPSSDQDLPLTPEDYLQAGDHLLMSYRGTPPPAMAALANHTSVLAIPGGTLDILKAYVEGRLPPSFQGPGPGDIHRIILLGSTKVITEAHTYLFRDNNARFTPKAKWIMAVTTPMQCMMQGVCGRCLQRHNAEGNHSKTTGANLDPMIFSCRQQDQDLTTLDVPFMLGRLSTDAVQEKLFAKLVTLSAKSQDNPPPRRRPTHEQTLAATAGERS